MIFLLLALFVSTTYAIIPICMDATAPVPRRVAGQMTCGANIPSESLDVPPRIVCCPINEIYTPYFCTQEAPLPPSTIGTCENETYVLAKDELGENVCCVANLAVTGGPPVPTTPAAVTEPEITTPPPVFTTPRRPLFTTRARCVDLIHPLTGVSDCPARAMLCNDPTYYDLMTKNCPRTCGRCSSSSATTRLPGTGGGARCVDLINLRTGVSDCPSLRYLCNDSEYFTLMTKNCPRTCGRCSSSSATTRLPGTGGGARCVDLINLRTGVSDCPSLRYLCNDSEYFTLMTKNCPRTCGRCPSVPSVPSPGGPILPGLPGTGGGVGGVCMDQPNRYTGLSDCGFRRHLCRDYVYATLMRTQCPATCGFC